jgi:hypothetical protein
LSRVVAESLPPPASSVVVKEIQIREFSGSFGYAAESVTEYEPVESEGEVEGGSFFDGSFYPHFPTMPLHNPSNGRQADTIAGEFRDGMKSMEGLEKTIGGPGVETAAIILHEIDDAIIPGVLSELNPSIVVMRGVLPRITQRCMALVVTRDKFSKSSINSDMRLAAARILLRDSVPLASSCPAWCFRST